MHNLESLIVCQLPIMIGYSSKVGYSPTTIFSTTNDENFVIVPIFTDAVKANHYLKKLNMTLLKDDMRQVVLLTIGDVQRLLFTFSLDKSAMYYIAIDPVSPTDKVLVHSVSEVIAAFGDKSCSLDSATMESDHGSSGN